MFFTSSQKDSVPIIMQNSLYIIDLYQRTTGTSVTVKFLLQSPLAGPINQLLLLLYFSEHHHSYDYTIDTFCQKFLWSPLLLLLHAPSSAVTIELKIFLKSHSNFCKFMRKIRNVSFYLITICLMDCPLAIFHTLTPPSLGGQFFTQQFLTCSLLLIGRYLL